MALIPDFRTSIRSFPTLALLASICLLIPVSLQSQESIDDLSALRDRLGTLEPDTPTAVRLGLHEAFAVGTAALGDDTPTRDAAIAWRDAARDHGDRVQQAAANNHLAWHYTRTADFDLALTGFLETLGDDGLLEAPALRGDALHGMGRVHGTRGDFETALPPLMKARDVFENLGDHSSVAEVDVALGNVHIGLANVDQALLSFATARDTFEKLGDRRKQLVAAINVAATWDRQGHIETAMNEFKAILPLGREVGTDRDLALILINIGESLIKLDRADEAIAPLEESLRLAEKTHATQMQSWARESLALACEKTGRYAEALFHHREFKRLHDLIFSEESDTRVAELQARWEAEKREAENQKLHSENELNLARISERETVLFALAIGAVLLGISLFALVSRHRDLRKANTSLAEGNDRIMQQKTELESLRTGLEEQVVKRTMELTRVNRELRNEVGQRNLSEQQRRGLQGRLSQSRKMEAVGLLAGSVAHDFNNLLTGIMMATELALRDSPADGDSPRAHHRVMELARRAAHLTSQLLAFSHQQVMQTSVIPLHQAVESSFRDMSANVGKRVTIQFVAGADRDLVEVDPGQIERVLVNLAVNAHEAMPDGGLLLIETNLETLAGNRPDHGDLEPGRYVSLKMTDQGIGMDEEVLEHIFEPFFTTHVDGDGRGLGLATVHGIVRQHGGSIRVESRSGEGATFEILLPLAVSSRAAPDPHPPS